MKATDTTSVRIAVAGQPNAGKTSIFNALTGATGHVGNYPGVTVERRVGRYRKDGISYEVSDLPGTYSLSSFSPEERVAESELIDNRPEAVVVVVDSTALTRSLVFLAQIMHLGVNAVLALNMSDEARSAGQQIDVEQMSLLLGCPVVETEGHRARGIDALKEAIAAAVAKQEPPRPPVLGERLTKALATIEEALELTDTPERIRSWVACRLLAGSGEFEQRVHAAGEAGHAAVATADAQRAELVKATGQDIEVFLAARYHGFAHGLVTECCRRRARTDSRALSDAADRVLAHKLLGMPVFLAVMYTIFWMTFSVGEIPMGWIETGFALLGDTISQYWPQTNLPALRSLVLDGVIAGVGGVVVFLPNIVLLFLGLALLEDTGYMARAAFLMDQLMHRFGLHGKSFLPMLTGFGCTVPGIMATRTMENERDRLITMLVLPLMSCGARLPIWMLLVPAFFPPQWRTPALMFIYLGGALLALIGALLLRRIMFRGTEAPFVMELPPYRVPTGRAMLNKMGERSMLYLRKAGTVILGISIVMWFITAYPEKGAYEVDARLAAGEVVLSGSEAANERASEDLRHSAAGRIGVFIEPVLAPLGFDWKLATGMIGSFAAKEVFVAQMGIVHSLGEADESSLTLREKLARNYSPLTGISMILFLLVATPCMATVAVTRRETGTWKWPLFQFGGLTVLAWLLSFAVYQGGQLLGLG